MGIAFLGQATSMTIGGTIAAVSSWRGVFIVYAAVAVVIVVALLRHHALAWRPSSRATRTASSCAPTAPARPRAQPAHLPRRLRRGPPHPRLVQLRRRLRRQEPRPRDVRHRPADGRVRRRRHRRQPHLWTAGAAHRPAAARRPRPGLRAAADLLWPRLGSHLGVFAVAILLLGLGFMFAHSSLLTTATQFAEKARGAAMSLIAFAFMVGGSLGTMLGGRIIWRELPRLVPLVRRRARRARRSGHGRGPGTGLLA